MVHGMNSHNNYYFANKKDCPTHLKYWAHRHKSGEAWDWEIKGGIVDRNTYIDTGLELSSTGDKLVPFEIEGTFTPPEGDTSKNVARYFAIGSWWGCYYQNDGENTNDFFFNKNHNYNRVAIYGKVYYHFVYDGEKMSFYVLSKTNPTGIELSEVIYNVEIPASDVYCWKAEGKNGRLIIGNISDYYQNKTFTVDARIRLLNKE